MYGTFTSRAKVREVAPEAIRHHFSRIANRYRHLRLTDPEPVAVIGRELKELSRIDGADIGCGDGRYDLLLCKHLGNRLHLVCVDANNDMLAALSQYLKGQDISNYMTTSGHAEHLPFLGGSLDCIFSFNAVHHFNLLGFLEESARVLRTGGHLFIYTRLQEQNRRNIWGQHFPEFCRKEARLYQLNTFMETVAIVAGLRVESIEHFVYQRVSTLELLERRARDRHYSTFCLYSPEELQAAIAGFRRSIQYHHRDVHRIRWRDENTLFIIRAG